MIRAIRYSMRGHWLTEAVAGSFWIDHRENSGERAFWYYCPCGCRTRNRIIVGEQFKPDWPPTWEWDGSWSDPTLLPSINQTQCGWHGWLSLGYWEAI